MTHETNHRGRPGQPVDVSSVHRRPFVGGNWKMNSTLADAVELTESIVAHVGALTDRVDIVIFPPFPYLQAVGRALGHHAVAIGAQNCWPHRSGAFTGEVGLQMLDDLGIGTVLVGHSERRQHGHEDDELVAAKTIAALDAGLRAVLCVGETLAQRDAGDAERVICGQVASALAGVVPEHINRLVIAYEPVWAIGTGQTASGTDAQAGHAAIRRTLAERYDGRSANSIRIIYGGSVTAANAAGLLSEPDVDGALVGGASLSADAFLDICAAVSR